MRENLGTYEISEAFIKKGRFYVRVHYGAKRPVIPRAVYVWLKHNQSFASVPVGYVIHHLDLDPLNDDPSNLALMQKFHHIAYHWKYKNIECNVVINEQVRTFYMPTRKPTVNFHKGRKKFRVQFYENNPNSTRNKRIHLFHDETGMPFLTKESAEKYSNKVWEEYQSLLSDSSNVVTVDDRQRSNICAST